MRHGSLFSGYLGLDMAAQAFFPGELAWTSEIDDGARKILETRTPDVPNLGDITEINWDMVEPVDVLTAGWPCQPFSLAGKRKGTDDIRALWPYVAEAIRRLRPGVLFLENVAAIATAGELARALTSLASLGYVGSWRRVRASEAGAPHQRARIFILAVDADNFEGHRGWACCSAADAASEQVGSAGQSWEGGRTLSDATGNSGRISNRDGRTATDAARDGRQERRAEPAGQLGGPSAAERGRETAANPDSGKSQRRGESGELGSAAPAEPSEGDQRQRPGDAARHSGATTANADGLGLQGVRRQQDIGYDADRRGGADTAWGDYEPAIRRWEQILGRAAPSPTEPNRNGKPRLSPRFEEWMMGLPDGWVTGVPGLNREQQMRALGNGVVPQQALHAIGLMTAWPC
jgi:DNA (cytosine-5)-methyltransferase 1